MEIMHFVALNVKHTHRARANESQETHERKRCTKSQILQMIKHRRPTRDDKTTEQNKADGRREERRKRKKEKKRKKREKKTEKRKKKKEKEQEKKKNAQERKTTNSSRSDDGRRHV